MKQWSYEDALAYMKDVPKFTKKHDNEHTRIFLRYLGDPQKDLRIIHVAGTNGKGSVCAYLSAMLQKMGYHIGNFTSPHLVKINERMMIDQLLVTDEEFASVFTYVMEKIEQMKADGYSHPSYFELLLGMGMVVFARHQVDYVVMETGLGGRLDATNAIEHPILTVITSISLDHTQYLGTTIEEVAYEKAGIMKEGTPAICQCTDPVVEDVIDTQAKKVGCDCKKIADCAFEILENTGAGIAFSPTDSYYEGTVFQMKNLAVYQAMNGMLALEGMRSLFPALPVQISWKQAIEETVWEGRMEEVVSEVILDGAHNPGAIDGFIDSVKKSTKEKILLFSAVEDKDYETMIQKLCERLEWKEIIVTTLQEERGADPEKLAQLFRKYGVAPVYEKMPAADAFAYAREKKKPGELLYAIGSLYLVGEIKKELHTK